MKRKKKSERTTDKATGRKPKGRVAAGVKGRTRTTRAGTRGAGTGKGRGQGTSKAASKTQVEEIRQGSQEDCITDGQSIAPSEDCLARLELEAGVIIDYIEDPLSDQSEGMLGQPIAREHV